MGCIGSGGVNKPANNNLIGDTSIALIGVSGQGKTQFCKALSTLYGSFTVLTFEN